MGHTIQIVRQKIMAGMVASAVGAAAMGCASRLTPDDLLRMSLQMHERSPYLEAFGDQSAGRGRFVGVTPPDAQAAFEACRSEPARWERLPSRSEPDEGLTHYWRCTSRSTTVFAEVYWGGGLGGEGHIGLDGVRYAACSPTRCDSDPHLPFEWTVS